MVERSWVWIPAGAVGEFSSPGSTFLFQYLFHLCVTTVARKRPQSFCQKCRWQVTAKHAHTLHMWLCMKWRAWLYGVHKTRQDGSSFMWHKSSQCSKYTTGRYWKMSYKKAVHSCRITCKLSESAREQRIALYKSDQHLIVMVQELCESRWPSWAVHPNEPSVDVKIYWTMLRHWSQLVPKISADIQGH